MGTALRLPIDKDEKTPKLTFHPSSCIVVLGQLKRGKTTTMNIYTENAASTGKPDRVSGETNQPSPMKTKETLNPDLAALQKLSSSIRSGWILLVWQKGMLYSLMKR